MRLPDYFRGQLPPSIRQMVDHPGYTPSGECLGAYTHMVQFTYPVVAVNGDPSETTLATVAGVDPMSFEVGQEVCLYGVWAQVASVETDTEKSQDDGRLTTFHTVMVREADR